MKWPKFLRQKSFLLVSLAAITTGCLSPATIRPVADQNSVNIKNYNANVAAIANALKREATFHGEIEIQIARNRLSQDLIQLPKKWLGPTNPTSKDLADSNKDPYKHLAQSVEKARIFRNTIADDQGNKEDMDTALAAKYPLTADIVLETPGFTIIRVINDAFTLKKLNAEILAEMDIDVAEVLMRKRNRLLDAYLSARIKTDLVQTYQEALKDYLSVVAEQGSIAAGHANSISAYAKSTPQVSTLASAYQDQELRDGVLELIKERRGEKFSKRVEGFLGKSDNVINVIKGFSN
jgi:very-short-patch-repair endonuclease